MKTLTVKAHTRHGDMRFDIIDAGRVLWVNQDRRVAELRLMSLGVSETEAVFLVWAAARKHRRFSK